MTYVGEGIAPECHSFSHNRTRENRLHWGDLSLASTPVLSPVFRPASSYRQRNEVWCDLIGTIRSRIVYRLSRWWYLTEQSDWARSFSSSSVWLGNLTGNTYLVSAGENVRFRQAFILAREFITEFHPRFICSAILLRQLRSCFSVLLFNSRE